MAASILQLLRYVAAIVLSSLIGAIISLPFSFALDILWGHYVSGGRWAFTLPNTILIVIQSAAMGASAGWIAGRRGKLIAALADFFPLTAITIISLILNRDIAGAVQAHYDTNLAFWAWIGLLPALLVGHYTIKYKYLGFGAVLVPVAAIMGCVAYIGMSAFHFYTCIVAYQVAGTGSAVLAFVIPPFSEIFWFWQMWRLTGTFWNIYTERLSLLLAWGFSAAVLAILAAYLADKRQRQRIELGETA